MDVPLKPIIVSTRKNKPNCRHRSHMGGEHLQATSKKRWYPKSPTSAGSFSETYASFSQGSNIPKRVSSAAGGGRLCSLHRPKRFISPMNKSFLQKKHARTLKGTENGTENRTENAALHAVITNLKMGKLFLSENLR